MATEYRAPEVHDGEVDANAGARPLAQAIGEGVSDSDPAATAVVDAESAPDPAQQLIDELSQQDDFTAALKAWYQRKDVPPQWNEWQKIAYLLARQFEETFGDLRGPERTKAVNAYYPLTMKEHYGAGWRLLRPQIRGADRFEDPTRRSRSPVTPVPKHVLRRSAAPSCLLYTSPSPRDS